MSVTITRTNWIDDDGTGTTGTVLNNAVKTDLYNQIDGALAKVAQLTGDNVYTGTQFISGGIGLIGSVVVSAPTGSPSVSLNVRNAAPGAGNNAELALGNDTQGRQLIFQAFASNFASQGTTYVANGVTMTSQGSGGLVIQCTDAAGTLRFATTNLERLRIVQTGEVLINTTTATPGQLAIVTDGAVHYGFTVKNSNPANSINYLLFYNSADAVTGNIAQNGASAVVYGTTSDARLKDDAGPAADLAALRALIVHDFTWKADGIADRGVFAQEAAPLFPRAVLAGTDETTAGGHLARPWMTDYSKFVPDLIVGWQQHDAEIAELRAALASRGQ